MSVMKEYKEPIIDIEEIKLAQYIAKHTSGDGEDVEIGGEEEIDE